MRLATIFVATAALSGALAASPTARAGVFGYSFTAINVPGTAPGNTILFGINDLGQVVGNFVDNTGLHGFLYSHGKYTTINAPGSTVTELAGINNLGQILGASNAGGTFIYARGTFTTIGAPGFASAINDLGQIAGDGAGADGQYGYVYTRGRIMDIAVPGAEITAATGINDRGQTTGQYDNPDGSFGSFLDTGGTFTTINVPGSAFTDAFGINNLGQIVGAYCNMAITACPDFIDTNGNFTTNVSPPGFSDATVLVGINDWDQVITQSFDNGILYSFLGTPTFGLATLAAGPRSVPVSEPASGALVIVGLFGLGLIVRRRRA
jgi:probable HAF family extracellular repeat protein